MSSLFEGLMRNYSKLLKIALGFSIILSVIAVMALGVFNNLDSDKLGITLFTHPPLLLYVYFLSKFVIREIKEPLNLDAFMNFILLSVIAMLLPFYLIYLYFIHGVFNILLVVSLYLVILWVINIIIYFLERGNKAD